MPWSSLRSSGWRATDWIIEPKMMPMPTPAPAAPSPTPRARPIALPAFVTSPVVAARMVPSMFVSSLVLRLDRRADVDGGQGGEDERLDADDDDHLEDVEDRRDRQDQRGEPDRLEDEHQADEGEDQDVPGEHVREESDAQREQAHELADDLQRDDQQEQRPRRLRDPALEVADRAVPAHALDVREYEGQQREGERHRQRRRRGVDPPRRHAVPLLAGQRQRDEADQVDREDEEQQRGDVRKPQRDRLRRQALLGDLYLGDLV